MLLLRLGVVEYVGVWDESSTSSGRTKTLCGVWPQKYDTPPPTSKPQTKRTFSHTERSACVLANYTVIQYQLLCFISHRECSSVPHNIKRVVRWTLLPLLLEDVVNLMYVLAFCSAYVKLFQNLKIIMWLSVLCVQLISGWLILRRGSTRR